MPMNGLIISFISIIIIIINIIRMNRHSRRDWKKRGSYKRQPKPANNPHKMQCRNKIELIWNLFKFKVPNRSPNKLIMPRKFISLRFISILNSLFSLNKILCETILDFHTQTHKITPTTTKQLNKINWIGFVDFGRE